MIKKPKVKLGVNELLIIVAASGLIATLMDYITGILS